LPIAAAYAVINGETQVRARMEVRWWALSAAALVMGGLLSWLTWVRSEAVLDVARPLVDRDLPALRAISELKVAAMDGERIARELYDTTDRERFGSRHAELQRRTASRMTRLDEAITDPEGRALLDALRALQRDGDRLLSALDRELDSSRVDIGEVSKLLGRISVNATELTDRFDVLVGGVQTQAEERGDATRERLADILRLVTLFSALLLAAAAVIGYFFDAHLRGIRERQRLALFPERNPNPVISLDEGGALAYANPGAVAMARRLGVQGPSALLSEDLASWLDALRRDATERVQREYRIAERVLAISIHRLADSGAFHVYLSDVTERSTAQEQLEFQAFHDVLTRLPNRLAFENRIAAALDGGHTGAVLLLAADRFQPVVDTLGHAFADRVLCGIARRIEPLAGDDSIACCLHRFDGELFAALLPVIGAADEADAFAARITREMAAPFIIEGREMYFSFSIGFAVFPQDGRDVAALLRNADTALQGARRAGDHRALRYAEDMSARALERLETEHRLRRAVERGELELRYQPQVEIGSGRIAGVEALVSWRHPDRGLIPPSDFIPIAEESGAIVEIGAWVLEHACAQARQWQNVGLPPLVMAVNISPRQFADPELPRRVLHALRRSGLPPERLELEVTEGAAMHDVEAAVATLHAFKTLGVRLSIDDFGTGHSSLAYLKRFPIDKLKVDQSFVRNMHEDPSDAAIARTVITLGHSLGLTVIAEGVETEAHLRLLRDYGCDEIQGYFFSRPRPAFEVRAMLEQQRSIRSCAA